MDLPIFEIKQTLLEAVAKEKRLILTAPTGSGKSTQVPQMLLDGGLLRAGRVTVLQPRRLPTRMLATWVAQARDVKLGSEVGYQMRFENVTSAATRICYVTEGVLLRQMLADPDLTGISAIVFDEFHERHLYGDITLARALEIQRSKRPDLIIIVMSATLDIATVQTYLERCAVLSAEGRAYPVAIEYLTRPLAGAPVWEVAAKELQRLVRQQLQGDVLIFMPGAYEITRTVQALQTTLGQEFVVFPLHGELPPGDQDAALARYERRKIIVSTNVAETSLTIGGVRLVIDSGLARIPRYDPYRGINTLLVDKISRASADQRAGRAGRTAPGHCLRLWTVHDHSTRPAQELPEVKRLDLSEVILTLKASGVNDVTRFRWLEAPDARALERAEMLLIDLGAVDGRTGVITALGRRMLAFPVHPRYGRMLLAAGDFNCVRPVALIAALTQGRHLVVRRPGKQGEATDDIAGEESESDFFVLMRAWWQSERNRFDVERCRRMGIHAQAARQVGPLFQDFLRIAAEQRLDISDKPFARDTVQRCVLAGFSDHLAKRTAAHSLRCELVHGRRGMLSRESVVRAPLFVAAEVREVESSPSRERNLNVILSLATAINEEWLQELFPDDVKKAETVNYDPSARRVISRKQTLFRDLVLTEEIAEAQPSAETSTMLARAVISCRLPFDHWDDTVEQWILRVNRLREWMPALHLPPICEPDRAWIIEQLCHGATSYNQIKDLPVLPLAKSRLSHQQQRWIEQYAPERIKLPNGRMVKVLYSADAPPTIAARIQDLYGIKEKIWIADRRAAVRIQVLAPSNRPVQVTDDLSLFWRETYPKLKQQLQRRYPKHDWR